jgi:hypothetical protein
MASGRGGESPVWRTVQKDPHPIQESPCASWTQILSYQTQRAQRQHGNRIGRLTFAIRTPVRGANVLLTGHPRTGPEPCQATRDSEAIS